jgi:Zn finger protein HypA/HybF involved in hydrogenase expression
MKNSYLKISKIIKDRELNFKILENKEWFDKYFDGIHFDIVCNKCFTTKNITYTSLKHSKVFCFNCGKDIRIYTKEDVSNKIKEFNKDIHVIDYMYEGSTKLYNLKLYCDNCTNEWTTSWTKFNRKYNRCCPNCGRTNKNNFIDKYPQYVEMIVNKKDRFLSPFSRDMIEIKCPTCKNIYIKKMCIFTLYPYSCPSCSSGVSLPERFFFNLLKELNVEFETQKIFDNSLYRYDFYIILDGKSYTIETHGQQHYETNNLKGGTQEDLIREINNDIAKRKFSESIGNIHIEINCKKSSMLWLKNNIIKSVGHIFNFDNIDWLKIYMNSSKSSYSKIIELYNEGALNKRQISKIVGVSEATVSRYIKSYLEGCDAS